MRGLASIEREEGGIGMRGKKKREKKRPLHNREKKERREKKEKFFIIRSGDRNVVK